MSILALVRPDLQQFSGYLSARKQNSGGAIWLNANESAYAQAFDTLQLNRYPGVTGRTSFPPTQDAEKELFVLMVKDGKIVHVK